MQSYQEDNAILLPKIRVLVQISPIGATEYLEFYYYFSSQY